ncbi:MlaD family protein [Actinomadura rupiterrae]|uniref:MlaD family protein n=1 Tax=Actinomadura rupiterrae TaxID=559627 RepID=UPI0020A5207A|nr:MlaD family protein [Actinomadura rupiterrae]MCP2339119.1 phospholipid/cholesterol/gamma-HCH transport system substrate-binding protein [Actinomadura rupiterrae]
MITLATRVKVIGFCVIAVVTLAFVGVKYAALGGYVGYRDYYTVNVELAQAGGLARYADVTYHGVSVGRVGPIRLTDDGVVAELRIKKNAPRIPADLTANVANRSAVGEEYIDLRPTRGGGPYLANGSHIARAATSTPAPVTDLLQSLTNFAGSVPLDDMRTVVQELGLAFNGQSQNLQALLDQGRAFTRAADEHVQPTKDLITDSETVLGTQNQEADALKSFGRNARLLARQLRDSDGDFRRVVAAAPGASEQFAGLVRDVDPQLSVLIANLLTTSDLLVTRVGGMEELLVKAPRAVAAGNSVIKDGRLQFGMVTTFFQPLPCTRGYEGTRYRNGLDTSSGPPLNTAARCALPASSGVDVRGPGNAPDGGVPTPARPGSVLSGAVDPTLPGALGLPNLPSGAPTGMAGLLGVQGGR